MNRTIGGIPLIYWIGALGLGIGAFAWIKKRGASSSPATAGATAKTPAFSQAQEVQDFQVFQALTGAQQGADLNFLTEAGGLFGGGSSTAATGSGSGTGSGTGSGSGGSGGSPIPAPVSTGTVPPATVPASTVAKAVPTAVAAPAPAASSEPGYGSGVAQLLANNPGLTTPGVNTPGITGYTVSYNGVPI